MNKSWRLVFAGLFLLMCTSALQAQTYVGSTACAVCHGAVADTVAQSGHPYKLNEVVGGVAPTYPHSAVPTPPDGVDWDDVSYVIGGYGWKARFIGLDGYIITGDTTMADVQYNLETKGWATYHTGEQKPYDCGSCHTTGWVAADADSLSLHQNQMPGMHGTFSEPGIQCEGCHGPGSEHAAAPSASNISKVENCGDCHIRDDVTKVNVSGGFIRHHEQWEEMASASHSTLDCGDCHSAHKGTVYGLGGVRSITETCVNCHAEEAKIMKHNSNADCVDCHMPEATKSAVAENIYNGDLKTHVFNIDVGSVGMESMWDDGSLAVDADSNTFVTLDFACYGCHQDADGVGGDASKKTLEELSKFATSMHSNNYAKDTACSGCHASIYADYVESGHPYKLNKVEGGVAPTYPGSTVPNPPTGYTWDDITYVIGGYNWKARFIGLDGYIITGDANMSDVQYNLATEGWASYHTGEVKAYDCGTCHTTGWIPAEADDIGAHQDSLAGMYGTFSEPGVRCEGCHGPSKDHVEDFMNVKPSTVENCANCHIRDDVTKVNVSGGFVRHHEQWEEMASSGHRALSCTGQCHDPHKSTVRDMGGFVGEGTATCETCHSDKATANNHNGAPDCIDCHMGKATKSAIKINEHEGDVKTHVFAVNPGAVSKDAMWDDGSLAEDADGNTFLTLDFACYSCHKDEDGVGGNYSTKTLSELSKRAMGIHGTVTEEVGVEDVTSSITLVENTSSNSSVIAAANVTAGNVEYALYLTAVDAGQDMTGATMDVRPEGATLSDAVVTDNATREALIGSSGTKAIDSSAVADYFVINTNLDQGGEIRVEVVLTYDPATFSFAESDLTVARLDESAGRWQRHDTVVDTVANTVTFTTHLFSVWVLGDNNDTVIGEAASVPLPVELVTLNGSVESGRTVTLTWNTASETNNYGFYIERSIDGETWEEIGFVEGNGTTETEQAYVYQDETIIADGRYSYRLRQVDFNGDVTISNDIAVQVEVPTEYALNQNYPNPFNPSTNIAFALKEAGNVTLTVYNVLGQKVRTLIDGEHLQVGRFVRDFDMSEMSSGIYFYRLEVNNFSNTRKMMLLK